MTMLVLLVTASTVTAGPAVRADAVTDPAGAIQRRLVPGHGVRIVQRTKANWFGSWSTHKPVRGVVGFGKGKIVATDLTNYNLGRAGIRNICIGKRGYQLEARPDADRPLPPGKRWVTYEWPCRLDLKSGHHLSLSDPATLRAVLATTTSRRPAGMYDGVRTTVHEGVITFAQLHKVNPDMRIGARSRPTGEYASWKVSWRLWIGPDQLVRRAWSAWRDPNDSLDRSAGEPPYYSFVEDLRLSDWGMKVDIQPPPADETVSSEELDD
ncbi:hypothetical protein ACFFV7_48550 [Nonomuraea spiralis]|uniref:Uncharacterized protein n=1 Tax=Nonomuraea spiralis TaxID=46182 RepID=A0ABV5IX16_9ACTN|nr:hypothetical protein [Nonomuraea spiralis]GGT22164.1 hypothetical protein GCM10010176_078360 [Nonomuraea spiralis]